MKITVAHKCYAKRPHLNASPEIFNAIYFPPLGTTTNAPNNIFN
jgi:hypothetical protein